MSHRARQFLAFVVTAVTVTACTVVVEEPRPVAPRPQACTFEYAPVCGRRGNQQRTFANACNARASGFAVVHRGQCRASSRPSVSRPIACTLEHAPVCARRGNQQRNFSNACNAQASGFVVVHRGQCRTSTITISNRPVACTREFAPVCATRGNTVRTFDNACLARADGFRTLRAGRCR
jgi:hypothetical protein